MTKKELKIRAQIQHHLDKVKQYEEKLDILLDNPVLDWVREADNLGREWTSVSRLHKDFLNFMDIGDDTISKHHFGRLITKSELFIKRNGVNGREWKLSHQLSMQH